MKKMMKSKGMAKGGKMKSKGMARGGRTAMKSKGYAKGGKTKSKGASRGGKKPAMTLAAIRSAAKAKGYKLVKA
nr:hypothetical protein 55 [Alphaproteobacteria bacterium]